MYKSMVTDETLISIIISSVAVIVSIVAVVFSFLHNREHTRSLHANTFMSVVSAHRDLIMSIYSNRSLCDAAKKQNILGPDINMVATLYINHAYGLFYYRKKKMIKKKEWIKINNELADIFSIEFIRQTWIDNHDYYPFYFNKYVQNICYIGDRKKKLLDLPTMIYKRENRL